MIQRRGRGALGSDFIIAEDKIREDLSELSGDIWRDKGIHKSRVVRCTVKTWPRAAAPPTLARCGSGGNLWYYSTLSRGTVERCYPTARLAEYMRVQNPIKTLFSFFSSSWGPIWLLCPDSIVKVHHLLQTRQPSAWDSWYCITTIVLVSKI